MYKIILAVIIMLIFGCKPQEDLKFEPIVADTLISQVSKAFRTYRKTNLNMGYRESQMITEDKVWNEIDHVDFLQVGWDETGDLSNDLVTYRSPIEAKKARIIKIFNQQRMPIARLSACWEGRGMVWEVGNEPNLFPYMSPIEAAALVRLYGDFIHEQDETAKIMHGGLFVTEGYPGFGKIVGLADSNVITCTATYLDSLLSQCSVDIGNIHIYPIGMVVTKGLMRALREISDVYNKHGVTEIWVTEVGNANPYMNMDDILSGMDYMIKMLAYNNIGITRWYWYKATGYDHKYDRFKVLKAPITALVDDNGDLTEIGKKYKHLHKILK